jgi:glycosyltransferase involved in cell wall biosynthesis
MHRILILFPGPSYGVDKKLLSRLECLSRRFEGTVITTSSSSWLRRIGRFSVVAVKQRPSRIGGLFYYLAVALQIARRPCNGPNVSLVVTYDPLRSGLVGVIIARVCRAKLLVEVNGDYGNIANYMEVENGLARRFKRQYYVGTEKFVLRRSDAIRLLYPSQLQSLGFKLKDQVVRAYPNIIHTSGFRNIDGENIILSVGFPMYVKGMDLLISAFLGIADKIPDWKLEILGYYPNQEELLRLTKNHPRISILRPVSHDEMPGIMGRCGIFVLASRTEAMGRVLVEAAAAGKARIGTRVGGIPTVIEHEKDGLLAESNDAEEIQRAILRLAKDKHLRQRLGHQAYLRAHRDFTPERWAANTESHYLTVIGEHNTR